MADPSKAIGLRLPHHIWEQVKAYGMDNYPSETSKDGIDVTRTVVSLICQALGTTLDTPVISLSDEMITERTTIIVQQQLSALYNDNSALLERLTHVEQQLSEHLTDNVQQSLSKELTELEKSSTSTDLTNFIEELISTSIGNYVKTLPPTLSLQDIDRLIGSAMLSVTKANNEVVAKLKSTIEYQGAEIDRIGKRGTAEIRAKWDTL